MGLNPPAKSTKYDIIYLGSSNISFTSGGNVAMNGSFPLQLKYSI